MMRSSSTLVSAFLLIIASMPQPIFGSCPSCADSVVVTNPSACGRWEAIEPCTYPVPATEAGACAAGKWPYGLHAVHMALMHTGRVLIYGHTQGVSEDLYSNIAHYWDYRTAAEGGQANRTLAATPLAQGIDLECNAMVIKSNGKLLGVGGVNAFTSGPDSVFEGIQVAYLFDAEKFEASSGDSGWARTADMALRRYYPTATVLPDGRVLVASGQIYRGDLTSVASPPEIYDEKEAVPWSSLSSAPTTGTSMSVYYPFLHVLPGPGTRVLHSGRTLQAGSKMQTLDLDASSPNWQATGVSATMRGGTSLFYDAGRLLKTGGLTLSGSPVVTETEIVVANATGVTSATQTASMGVKRIEHNMVALPNGTALIVGGGIRPATGGMVLSDATYRTEVFTPPADPTVSQGEMCKVAWMRHRDPDGGGSLTGIPRMYHSTAILLPDGRVLAAGGEVAQNEDAPKGCPQPAGIGIPSERIVEHCISADFYKPPYLFRSDNTEITASDRPQINSMPATVGTGSAFVMTLSSLGTGASAITGLRCIRPSATTHSYDFEQRSLALPFSLTSTNNYSVTAPATLNDAPPGYYMMFLMNDAGPSGHPSMAEFVQVWGIPEASIQVSVSYQCGNPGIVRFTVSWKTTLPTTNSDLLVLYPPGTTCLGAGAITATATPSGTNHSAMKLTTCASGVWQVVVLSARSDGSYSRSQCRSVTVACVSCGGGCHPPCQLE